MVEMAIALNRLDAPSGQSPSGDLSQSMPLNQYS